MPNRLLLSNVPYDCSEEVLKQWIENRGYPVRTVRLIRDYETGTSPSFAHVQLVNPLRVNEAERMLDGEMLSGNRILVGRVFTTVAARKSA